MLLRASLVSIAACILLAGRASASSGDHDPDQEAAGPTTSGTPRAIKGKPVHFDRAWLTPFFEHGHAQKAVERPLFDRRRCDLQRRRFRGRIGGALGLGGTCGD